MYVSICKLESETHSEPNHESKMEHFDKIVSV